MKKDELIQLVGKRVKVTFMPSCGGGECTGILGFTKEFSEKYDYRLPNYFTINQYDFKVSYVRKGELLER